TGRKPAPLRGIRAPVCAVCVNGECAKKSEGVDHLELAELREAVPALPAFNPAAEPSAACSGDRLRGTRNRRSWRVLGPRRTLLDAEAGKGSTRRDRRETVS